MHITINSGTTFLICDRRGNVPNVTDLGFYTQDARFLSRYELTLDGKPLLSLAATATDANTATHHLANPVLPGAAEGMLFIVRRRRIYDGGLHEDIEVTNYGDSVATARLELTLDVDFAHLLQVKQGFVTDQAAIRRHIVRAVRRNRAHSHVHIQYRHEEVARTLQLSLFPQPSAVRGDRFHFPLTLAARQTWRLTVAVQAHFGDATGQEPAIGRSDAREPRGTTLEHAREEATDAQLVFPSLTTDSALLTHAYTQSVRDFAALRISDPDLCRPGEFAIGAGIPWYMTLFGRDSLIAAYQSLPFAPEAARGTLRALARLQGTAVHPERGEEPGKILHEYRREHFTGQRDQFFQFPYYGTIDATPLFLMLLAAYVNVTGDIAVARDLREPALRALAWMEQYGDRDGDGYLEYMKQAETGLANQGWKDSFDAIRFSDGRIADPPIALCEVQGYAYAARLGMADVFAKLGEPNRALRLQRDAAALRRQFNRDFWLPERGTFALALDATKRPVDALTSNPGHLLWTGIADEQHAAPLIRTLLSPALCSGWGIRTMGSGEGGYNPISYHCGSIWPHDNSLIVAGLLRYGYIREARTVTEGLLQALTHYPDARFPELFAGIGTDEVSAPIEYFAANRPQAWATSAIFLLVAAMGGRLPVSGLEESEPQTHGFLPEGVSHLTIEGLWYQGQQAVVEVSRTDADSAVRVTHRDDQAGTLTQGNGSAA